jgi:hypothetical protein
MNRERSGDEKSTESVVHPPAELLWSRRDEEETFLWYPIGVSAQRSPSMKAGNWMADSPVQQSQV